MTLGITHTKVATLPDQPGVEINKAEWNDTHTIANLSAISTLIGSPASSAAPGEITLGANLSMTGSTLSASTGGTGSDVIFAAAPNTDFDLTNGGGGGAVTIISKSITGIAAGDQVELEVWYTISNNSAANRTYTPAGNLGSFAISVAEATAIASSATSRSTRDSKIKFSVSATNLSYGQFATIATNNVASSTTGLSGGNCVTAWNTSASDLTGTQTLTFTVASNSVTTTQTLTLHSYTIKKVSTL